MTQKNEKQSPMIDEIIGSREKFYFHLSRAMERNWRKKNRTIPYSLDQRLFPSLSKDEFLQRSGTLMMAS